MKIKELFNIQGKRFFITGGHTGVGRMIATSLVDGNAVDNDTAFVQIETTS